MFGIPQDHDGIFSAELDVSLTRLGLTVITTPRRSPQADSLCARLIGTLRRECLDWIIPLSEGHLRKILASWMTHYNRGRPHSSSGPGISGPKMGGTRKSNPADTAFRSSSRRGHTELRRTALVVYRERGHRRFAARTFQEKCWSCIWGCRIPHAGLMIIDQWNPSRRHYRTENPLLRSSFLPAIPSRTARKVPGHRRAMTYTEEAWDDDEATSYRRLGEQKSHGIIARSSGPDPTGRKSPRNACPWPPTE